MCLSDSDNIRLILQWEQRTFSGNCLLFTFCIHIQINLFRCIVVVVCLWLYRCMFALNFLNAWYLKVVSHVLANNLARIAKHVKSVRETIKVHHFETDKLRQTPNAWNELNWKTSTGVFFFVLLPRTRKPNFHFSCMIFMVRWIGATFLPNAVIIIK